MKSTPLNVQYKHLLGKETQQKIRRSKTHSTFLVVMMFVINLSVVEELVNQTAAQMEAQ